MFGITAPRCDLCKRKGYKSNCIVCNGEKGKKKNCSYCNGRGYKWTCLYCRRILK